jgi:hypothetical protein
MTSPIRQCCHYRLWQTAGLLTFSQVALDLWTFSRVALEFSRCGFLSMSVVWLFYSPITLEISMVTPESGETYGGKG